MERERLRIYIDMDHTFCDFNRALPYWRECALDDTEKTWPWSQKGFFRSLHPMEGAIEYWKKWEGECDLWFLTRPSFQNLHCYTEKAEWVKRHLGEEGLQKLILCPKKNLVIGDVLIDDDERAGQPDFMGTWWKFGSVSCPDWKTADRLTSLILGKNTGN